MGNSASSETLNAGQCRPRTFSVSLSYCTYKTGNHSTGYDEYSEGWWVSSPRCLVDYFLYCFDRSQFIIV